MVTVEAMNDNEYIYNAGNENKHDEEVCNGGQPSQPNEL